MALTRAAWVQKYLPLVTRLTKGTGIFAQIMMAQAIVESQGKIGGTYYPGQSTLAREHNNFFGIKANKGWDGQKVNLPTREVQNGNSVIVDAWFRKYDSVEDSMRDYVGFLLANKRYKDAGVFEAKTIQEQAQRIKDAGYATGESYADLITRVAKSLPTLPGIAGAGTVFAVIVLGLLIKEYGN